MRVTTPIGISIDLPEGWFDVTDDIEGENVPFTLGHEAGSGALQFSVGLYRTGRKPDPSSADLADMVSRFAAAHDLGGPTDCAESSSPLRIASATFHPGDFMRVWYAS